MSRICLLGNPAWPHVRKWAKYFIARPDYEIHIVSDVRPDFLGAEWHDTGKRSLPLPWTMERFFRYRKIFRRIKPDVLHAHNIESSFYPAILAWKGPLVATAYGLDVTLSQVKQEAQTVRAKKAALLKRAEVVTAASRFLLDVALNYADLPADRGMVTPFGVDLEAFQPALPGDKGGTTLGFFKDMKHEYSPLEFLTAFEQVRVQLPDAHAIMIGPGPLKEQVLARISSPALAGAVEYHERVPHEKMPEMFSKIDLCIMPSRQESFGVVALEAQAMKVPVIATRVEGLPEVVVDGETGILLEDNEPTRLAGAIVGLLADRERRLAMGTAGREFVEKNFSLEVNGEVMEEAYRRAMGRA